MIHDAAMKRAAVFILAGAVIPTMAHSASTQPKKGSYTVDGLITAVTAQGGATTCPSVNSTISWTFTYPGPAKTGATAYSSGVKDGNFKIVKRIFPETPAAGATAWGGEITEESSNGSMDTASFSTTTWQYFDASTLLFTMSINEPQSTGSCQETIELTFIKI